MFGRKRKKEEDNLGLSTPIVSSSLSVTPSDTSITPPVPSAAPTQPTPGQPFPQMPAAMAGYPTNVTGMLSQILSGHGPVGEMIAQIKADPEGFRTRIMQQAQAAGVSTYVMTPQGWTGAGPQQTHVDVIDELTKAAALHDKGALTDAEFEAVKKKLLAEE